MAELLEVKNLSVTYRSPRGDVQAVRDVSFSLRPGEVLAVVGESGCGKSALCRAVMRLLPDTSGYAIIDANRSAAFCQGCFRCWLASPGRCVMKDSLQTVSAQIGNAEAVIVLSRCCFGGFSPGVKRLLDRAIACSLPFFTYRGGHVHHPLRYQNRPAFLACFYGAATDFERETATRLANANRVNLGFSSARVRFAEKPELLAEVIENR